MIEKAKAFARKYHAGQLYDGKDYVDTHLADVASRVAADPSATDVHVAAAWLHDVMEDTDARLLDLLDAGFFPEIINIVSDLTKLSYETNEEYLSLISHYPDSVLVKYYDSAANYAYGRRSKYKKNMEFLFDFLPEASKEYLKKSS